MPSRCIYSLMKDTVERKGKKSGALRHAGSKAVAEWPQLVPDNLTQDRARKKPPRAASFVTVGPWPFPQPPSALGQAVPKQSCSFAVQLAVPSDVLSIRLFLNTKLHVNAS